jgi:hypothetical protein
MPNKVELIERSSIINYDDIVMLSTILEENTELY